MAKTVTVRRSQEEVMTQAAQLVAGTINPMEMGLTPEEIDVEQFVSHFKEKVAEMLEIQEAIYIAIGPLVNTYNPGIYSNDIRIILDSIEEKMQIKFYFHYGILLALGKNDLFANWLPH